MTAKQEKVLAALLTTRTRKEAAEQAGITERTLRDYFKDEEFRGAYREAFTGMVEDASRQAQQSLQDAIAVFSNVMKDTNETGATRVQAASKLIEYELRLTEQTDVLSELAELRKAVFPDES